MDVKIVKNTSLSKWSDDDHEYVKMSDYELLENLSKEIEKKLKYGYIPIGSPQKSEDGWFLIMHKKD